MATKSFARGQRRPLLAEWAILLMMALLAVMEASIRAESPLPKDLLLEELPLSCWLGVYQLLDPL